MPRKKLGLRVDLGSLRPEDSFHIEDDTFLKGEVQIGRDGISVDGTGLEGKSIRPDDLETSEVLGRGASSIVWKARHKKTGQSMAVKKINIFDKRMRDQLMREVETLYSADCPCLVKFYGAYYSEGEIGIGLEYMDRGCLASIDSSCPERVLASITFQVLWGISYLKYEKRVHRDVKPQNILMHSSGAVKLTDFGISRVLEASIGMAETYVGTFKYMSPERVQSQKYSYSSDIWSLGIVLVECATGAHPYASCESPIDMCQTILENEPSHLPETFSEEFREFIDNCLARNPSDRLAAEVLLGSPWLVMHGATDLETSRATVREWFDSQTAEAGAAGEAKDEAKVGK